jgi:hypothetical protein
VSDDGTDRARDATIRGWWGGDLEQQLAHTHLRLLEKSDRWTSEWSRPWLEAGWKRIRSSPPPEEPGGS